MYACSIPPIASFLHIILTVAGALSIVLNYNCCYYTLLHRELPSQPPDNATSGLKAVLRLRLTRTILRVMAHGAPDAATARALLMDIPENAEHPIVQLLFDPALAAAAAAGGGSSGGGRKGRGRGPGRPKGTATAAGAAGGSGGSSSTAARPSRKTGTRASSRAVAQPEPEPDAEEVCVYDYVIASLHTYAYLCVSLPFRH
jgi:hypothetical protein